MYKQAKDRGYFVKDKDEHDFEGWCWPGRFPLKTAKWLTSRDLVLTGSSMYLDFLNPAVRDFWANNFQFSEYEGSTESLFVWNDMNEPSVFNGPEVTRLNVTVQGLKFNNMSVAGNDA